MYLVSTNEGLKFMWQIRVYISLHLKQNIVITLNSVMYLSKYVRRDHGI